MKNTARENGFTLVEVLVAMVLFAFGILAVIQMQLIANTTNIKSRMMTEAIVVAQTEIERLMSLTYDDPDLQQPAAGADLTRGWAFTGNDQRDLSTQLTAELAATDHQPPNALPVYRPGTEHPIYKIGWNVQDDAPYPDTKTVRVIVKWVDKNVKQRFSMYMVKTEED